MKIVLKLLLALLVISPAYGLFNSEPASADPFECTSTFYQVILGTLVELDPITGDYTTLGGTASFNTNAIGYNVEDDFIYGIRPNAGTPELVRIELQAGSVLVTPLGVPTGLPAGSYVSGDFDDLGNLHVNSATNMYVIDVSAGTAVELPLSQNLPVNDIVFVDGFFYGTNGTNLYQVDPSNGNVVVTPLGLPAVNVYGAGWAADNSKLFFAHNPTGNIYEISDFDTVAPTYAQVLQGEDTIGNDGASCPTARSPIPAFTIADDSAETTVNTPITVNAENGFISK
jgi:hypothetical protein